MNIFISFAYTNTNITKTTNRLKNIVYTVNQSGNSAYCNLFDKSLIKSITNKDTKQIFNITFLNEEKADYVFLIISEPKVSIGQCMEIGVAVHLNIPIIVFEQTSAKNNSYITKLAQQNYKWQSEESLLNSILKVTNKLSPGA